MTEGNMTSEIMAMLGIKYDIASTEAMQKAIQDLNAQILMLQKTAASGVNLTTGGVGVASRVDEVQRLALAERTRAQTALADAKAIQAANAPMLQQSKQRINLANEELILTKAKGQYIKDVSVVGRNQSANAILDAKAATEAARESAIAERSRGQAAIDAATVSAKGAAASISTAKASTEAAREAAVAEKMRGQAARDTATAVRLEAQADTEATRQTLNLANAQRAEAQAALAAAKAQQVATGQVTSHATAQKGLYDRLYNTATIRHHSRGMEEWHRQGCFPEDG